MIIKLAKPLVWDDETFPEINLDLERLTGADSMAVTRELRKRFPKEPVMHAETDDRYILAMAGRASGIPEAALLSLPVRVFVGLKTEVQSFLLDAVSEENPNET